MAKETNTGAPAALKWLSDQVAASERDLERLKNTLDQAIADERDNPPEKDGADFARLRSVASINYDDAFDRHLKLLAKLNVFEKTVSPDKRDASESITKADGEKLIMHLVISLRTIAETFFTQVIPAIRESKSNEDAHDMSTKAFSDAIKNAVKTCVTENQLPKWVMDKVEDLL